MKDPAYTNVWCSVCGKLVGKRPGVQTVSNLICGDPLCSAQGTAQPQESRDSAIVSVLLDGAPVTAVAAATDMTRQRVYQIVDKWKVGA